MISLAMTGVATGPMLIGLTLAVAGFSQSRLARLLGDLVFDTGFLWLTVALMSIFAAILRGGRDRRIGLAAAVLWCIGIALLFIA